MTRRGYQLPWWARIAAFLIIVAIVPPALFIAIAVIPPLNWATEFAFKWRCLLMAGS